MGILQIKQLYLLQKVSNLKFWFFVTVNIMIFVPIDYSEHEIYRHKNNYIYCYEESEF